MRAAIVCVAAAAVLAAPSLAAAAPAWLATETISAPDELLADSASDASPVRIAAGSSGHAVAGWIELDGTVRVLRTALHRPGGAWTAVPGSVSQGLPGNACYPHIAMDRAGAAIVVWVQTSSGDFCTGSETVRFAKLAPGATAWSTSEPVEPPSTSWGFNGLGAHPDGPLIIAYTWNVGGQVVMRAAVGTIAGGPGAPVTLGVGASGAIASPVAAANSRGDVAVQWGRTSAGGPVNIVAAVRPRGASAFETPVPLTANTTEPGAGIDSAISIDEAGNVQSVFTGTMTEDAPLHSRLRTASNGVWQLLEVVDTSSLGFQMEVPRVVHDPAGVATAVWSEVDFSVPNPHMRRIHAATRAPGIGTPWTPVPLTEPFRGEFGLSVASDGAGSIVASWVGRGTTGAEVLASVRTPAGAFSPPAVVGLGEFRDAAMDGGGNAVVTSVSPVGEARVAVYDATAPVISAPVIPPALTTGQAGSFAATVVDAWAGLAPGSPVWSFGDGSTAPGAAASHAYTGAGTFGATLMAGDAVGNVSTATGTVAVTDPPLPPPPPVDPATLPAATLDTARVQATYRQSRLSGAVTASGRTNLAATLVVRLLTTGAGPRVVAQLRRGVPAGAFALRLVLPRTLVPGRYELELAGTSAGTALPPLRKAVRIKAPPEGVVGRAFAHGSSNGPAALRLRGARRELYATFLFAALPRRGPLTINWLPPRAKRELPGADKPREQRVTSSIRVRGGTLTPGFWRARLRAHGVLVAEVVVRIG